MVRVMSERKVSVVKSVSGFELEILKSRFLKV